MRKRLSQRVQESSWSRLITHILTELERLRAMNGPVIIDQSEDDEVGEGLVYARSVGTLPAITTTPNHVDFVYYQGQVWKARQGQTRWYPMDGPTTYSGVPGS
jgi:hypothetical protein